ncbi:albusnodin family lasso peptide [Streptomyces erythrochromogenes]
MSASHDANNTTETAEETATAVDLGDVADLTEGQGGGNSEDKRRAYNS